MPKQNKQSRFNPLIQALSFDDNNGLMRALNTDWILINGNMLRDILSSLSLMNGADSCSPLENVGKSVGKGSIIHLLKQGYKLNEIPTILELMINLGGWGRVQLRTDLNKKSGYFLFENNMIVKDAMLKEAYCRFVKGFLQGLTEELSLTNVDWVEKAHAFENNQVVCELILTLRK